MPRRLPPVIESDHISCYRKRYGYEVTFNDGSTAKVRYIQNARDMELQAAALPDALDMTPTTEREQTFAKRVCAALGCKMNWRL